MKFSTDRTIIGLRLAELRRASGLTQEYVAEKAFISRPTLANIEAGRRETPLTTLAAIAAVLQVDVTHVIGAEEMPGLPPAVLAHITAQLDRMSRVSRELAAAVEAMNKEIARQGELMRSVRGMRVEERRGAR